MRFELSLVNAHRLGVLLAESRSANVHGQQRNPICGRLSIPADRDGQQIER
jgi:hypothetical protein